MLAVLWGKMADCAHHDSYFILKSVFTTVVRFHDVVLIFSFSSLYFSALDDYEALQKLEFDTEDKIYKMLRNEFIITNNR